MPTKGVHTMPRATPSYPLEFKREAVRLVRSSPDRSVAQIAIEIGVSDNSLRNWLKQKEILRKALRPFSPRRTGSVEAIRAHRSKEKASYPISLLCMVLGVSRSGYYDWKDRPPSKRARENVALTHLIADIHQRSRRTYGYPRVHSELRALGVLCSRKRFARHPAALRLKRRRSL